MSEPRPLRIACLHGYLQNASRFRLKTSALRKALERAPSPSPATPTSSLPLAELVYIDAPFILDSIDASDTLSQDSPSAPASPADLRLDHALFAPHVDADAGRGLERDRTQRTWWSVEGRMYTGWHQSLEYLRTRFADESFDGILGFSQGAVAASLICAENQRDTTAASPFSSLRFAILISGFPSRAASHTALYATPLRLPSLHAWGLRDASVPPAASQMLLRRFAEHGRHTLEHANGHMVPQHAAARRQVVDFVQQFRAPQQENQVNAAL